MIWYPNLVFTGGSVYTGFAKDDTGNANAASWNGPTIAPRVCQPVISEISSSFEEKNICVFQVWNSVLDITKINGIPKFECVLLGNLKNLR